MTPGGKGGAMTGKAGVSGAGVPPLKPPVPGWLPPPQIPKGEKVFGGVNEPASWGCGGGATKGETEGSVAEGRARLRVVSMGLGEGTGGMDSKRWDSTEESRTASAGSRAGGAVGSMGTGEIRLPQRPRSMVLPSVRIVSPFLIVISRRDQ
jgi:hypothetical protein